MPNVKLTFTIPMTYLLGDSVAGQQEMFTYHYHNVLFIEKY